MGASIYCTHCKGKGKLKVFGFMMVPCAACKGRGSGPVEEGVDSLRQMGIAASNLLKWLAAHRSRSTWRHIRR